MLRIQSHIPCERGDFNGHCLVTALAYKAELVLEKLVRVGVCNFLVHVFLSFIAFWDQASSYKIFLRHVDGVF